jgi:hypothetical protein
MTSDATLAAVRQALTAIFSALAILFPTLAVDKNYSLATAAVLAGLPALLALASIAWSIYSHWGMKKVPEDATALLLPTPPPPKGTIVDLTPLAGMAKVV